MPISKEEFFVDKVEQTLKSKGFDTKSKNLVLDAQDTLYQNMCKRVEFSLHKIGINTSKDIIKSIEDDFDNYTAVYDTIYYLVSGTDKKQRIIFNDLCRYVKLSLNDYGIRISEEEIRNEFGHGYPFRHIFRWIGDYVIDLILDIGKSIDFDISRNTVMDFLGTYIKYSFKEDLLDQLDEQPDDKLKWIM